MDFSRPFEQFRTWYEEARRSGVAVPHAMALATVGEEGAPSSRMVLLNSFDLQGFVFYTNYESRKGREIANRPMAALLFWWEPQNRQIRIEGRVAKTSAAESDGYFASRPRGSMLGAAASDQSRPLPSRELLEARVRAAAERYAGAPVPRPPYWGGYRLVPHTFEFWEGRENRLHERLRFRRSADGWETELLYP